MAKLSINPISFDSGIATQMALRVHYDYSGTDMLVYQEYFNDAGILLNTSHIRIPRSTIPATRENEISIELHLIINNIIKDNRPLQSYGSFKKTAKPIKFIYELYEPYLEMHYVHNCSQTGRKYIYGTVPDSNFISDTIIPTLNVILTDDGNAVLGDDGQPLIVDDVTNLAAEDGSLFMTEDGKDLFALE